MELYSFKSLFEKEIHLNDRNVMISKIIIPKIQRDYAQGRETDKIEKIRNDFLNALYDSIINDKRLSLDFIYGDINNDNIFIPLDGQQRLTTLFLLYFYIAKKEKIDPYNYNFLYRFSYEIRYSSTQFCKELISHDFSFNTGCITNEIKEQFWFPYEWLKDPTIKSMLTMLDAIERTFKDTNNIWDKLENISFYVLLINDKNFDMTNDIYIKMNSRGEPLTEFENFKAELEKVIKNIGSQEAKDKSKEISNKIDVQWTDLMWHYKKDNKIDDQFIKFFLFIFDVIYCKEKKPILDNYSKSIFKLVNECFSGENAMNNVKIMEDYFDLFCKLKLNCSEFSKFFEKFIYDSKSTYEKNKVVYDSKDLFNDCIFDYGIILGNGNRKFPLGKLLMFYTFIIYLQNIYFGQNNILELDFKRRLRIIKNLIDNSNNEISASDTRAGGYRLPNMLTQIEEIVLYGIVRKTNESFNSKQIEEEIDKLNWEKDPNRTYEEKQKLYIFEDNSYIHGNVAVIGIENYKYFDKFTKLFKCDLKNVIKALLSTGEYGKINTYSNKTILQLGVNKESNEIWGKILHNTDFDQLMNTRKIIISLLDKINEPNDYNLEQYYEEYLKECNNKNEYDWRYYFIKYDFHLPSFASYYGNMFWYDKEKFPYELYIMTTKTKPSEYVYNEFLLIINDKQQDCRESLKIGNYYLKSYNNYFEIINEDGSLNRKIVIDQNEKGLDTEDRIVKIKKILNIM